MRRALILGAGVSGQAAARLADRLGMACAIYDESPSAGSFSVTRSVATGPWDPTLLDGMDLVITSPGLSERSAPIVDSLEAGKTIWSEVEFAARNIETPMAAVTGTNGKTTVTEAASAMLVASGLKAPAVGNIGSALSDQAGEDADCLVVEVSSFQLRFTEEFHPQAAAITNVAADHLDWHGSEYAYRQAKARIYANQVEHDLLVFDADDSGATELAAGAASNKLPVSGRRVPPGGAGVVGRRLEVEGMSIDIDDLWSSDPTHLVDIAIAAALATSMGAKPDGVAQGAREYQPGEHRRQLIAEASGVTWIDDSKATNPHAALASIGANSPVILIAGGLAKGLNLAPLADHPGVSHLIGIGEAGPDLVERAGPRGRLAVTLDKAVEIAVEIASPGDTVLLAPGCASFDQFSSYAQRGQKFTELVRGALG